MNNLDEIESERSPYVPSARKSIHQHNHCIFSNCENMGRYGLKGKNAEKTVSKLDQGVDEVDNVMSKFARRTSPVPTRQNRSKNRRNSLTVSNQDCTDDDDSDNDLLAKSLPGNLPSYYCSNDFAHTSLPSDFFKGHNSLSETSARQQMQSTEHYNFSNNHDTQDEDHIEYQSTPKKKKSCSHNLLLLIAVVGALAALGTHYYNDIVEAFPKEHNIHYYDRVKFRKDFLNLGEKYNINDNSILEVQSGISTILERNDTGSFIFVYNGRSPDIDFVKFSKFVEDVAATAARYLRNDSTSVKPTIVLSSNLDMKSHSELMNEYRQEVSKTGVMLVKDLDRVPSNLAMAFHYFCDEYNPLVAKSAIFFTLNLEKCSNISDQKSTHNGIEKCLENKWKSVPKDNIKPLLARVVNVVIDLTSV